ncbi:hypothetical protein HOV42_gp50 [Gordonia phage Fairfaxidum]|uniref:Uncharacterized protein n=2 Tax=Fairfaxidumvirus TaxID=2731207 RepID=A0A5J6TEF3_9CAUD|nr:hypothetical protein HOV42_gp50 [Gordonia phage Fairfaxidum]YP_010001186.1 hypothetical protein JZX81_gp49 [Gordonia phage Toast]QCG77633.1 hypothetical protein SEA_FAIRFAXIDUM_50 [Gordonia phage Fairfaxidum]QFG08109.1 hypothetical protein PBI_TOAST_49 [Gordonia phage Toast]UVF60557.1 hypothetical protein SEA_PCORAL7_49 [Gordonia phage PCoral7]
MSASDRYQGIAESVKVAATSTKARDQREAVGRAIEQLGDACARKGVDVAIVQTSHVGRPALRVAITNQRSGERLTERGDLLEVLDRALDRLNREDWDR